MPLSYVISYVIRENDNLVIRANTQFIDDYVDQALLDGPEYTADNEKVHSYIAMFISDNPVAEQKVQPIVQDRDGRFDFKLLCEHYEGVGVNANAIVKTEDELSSL